MRCQELLQRLRVTNPAAHERTLEVYPAAALRRWDLVAGSYKGAERRAALEQLVGRLLSAAPWLDVSGEQGDLLRISDDALDALISSLVARAAEVGLADACPEDSGARTEGWIVLPKGGSLSSLAM